MVGLKGLIVGIANEHSIAWGCAKVLHGTGAELAITYQNEKAKHYVQPLAKLISAPIFMPFDVTNLAQLDQLFQTIKSTWGRKEALPLMTNGRAIITVNYYGADKVVQNYNLMGPVKAALEASVARKAT